MSKLADNMNTSSLSESVNLENSKKSNKKEKSLEELLKEATELVRINAYCLSEKLSKSDTESEATETFNGKKFDGNIFEIIEEEIHRDLQKHKIEENKVNLTQMEESAPIYENLENLEVPKNNLQKELIAVDENFFDRALSNFDIDTENFKLDTFNFEQDKSSKQIEDNENNSFQNSSSSPKKIDDKSTSRKEINCSINSQSEQLIPNASSTLNVNKKSVNSQFSDEFNMRNKLESNNSQSIFSHSFSDTIITTSSECDKLENEDINNISNNEEMLQICEKDIFKSVNENAVLLKSPVNNKDSNNSTNFNSFNWISNSSEKKNFTHKPKEVQHKSFAKTKGNSINKVKVPLRPRKELFSIKKHNIVLKEKSDEIFIKKTKPELMKNKMTNLDKTSEELKKLTDSYEKEKREFMKDTEILHQEIHNLQQKIIPEKIEELHRQSDEIKELQKEIYKLNIELSELKQQNVDYLLNYDDMKQQNCLLNDELKMFKEQLTDKNNFISERLQTLTSTELNLRKETENLHKELNIKTESLKITKLNYEKLEQTILPLEKELLELRIKEGNFQEQLKIAKSHIEREKQLSLKLKNQVILDSKKIMDLMRQMREMERIIMKKNPDSVSALLLSANTNQDNINLEKIKLLEIRNASLENEIKLKEEAAQQRLTIFRKDFDEMIKKYATQILDLEDKLLTKSMKENENYIDNSTQTFNNFDESGKSCADNNLNLQSDEQKEQMRLLKNNSLKMQNKRNDVHLIATICKLKFELSNKNKSLSKLSKEFLELQKTNRRLQTEREKQLNEARSAPKNVGFSKKSSEKGILKSKSSDINSNNSNPSTTQCDYKDNVQDRLTHSKTYDPLQYHENSGNSTLKNLTTENNILREELFKMKKDFMALKNKRLHDLNLLQEEHERELKALVQTCNAKEEKINMLKLEVRLNNV